MGYVAMVCTKVGLLFVCSSHSNHIIQSFSSVILLAVVAAAEVVALAQRCIKLDINKHVTPLVQGKKRRNPHLL